MFSTFEKTVVSSITILKSHKTPQQIHFYEKTVIKTILGDAYYSVTVFNITIKPFLNFTSLFCTDYILFPVSFLMRLS